MSATAHLTQPRTPDGRWDRTGRTGPAGVRLDLTDEADVADVLARIRAAGARRIATLAYVADRRDLAEATRTSCAPGPATPQPPAKPRPGWAGR